MFRVHVLHPRVKLRSAAFLRHQWDGALAEHIAALLWLAQPREQRHDLLEVTDMWLTTGRRKVEIDVERYRPVWRRWLETENAADADLPALLADLWDELYDGQPCTCEPNCALNCKGDCGCAYHFALYAENFTTHDSWCGYVWK